MQANLYIGNYSKNGIDIYKLNGDEVKKSKLGDSENTSYIVKNNNLLYSVIEVADKKNNSGYVEAYDLRKKKKN